VSVTDPSGHIVGVAELCGSLIATAVFALMSPLSITNPSALREPTTKSAEDPSENRPTEQNQNKSMRPH
jgi:hypothetical protein